MTTVEKIRAALAQDDHRVGMDTAEVAKLAGVTPATARRHLHRLTEAGEVTRDDLRETAYHPIPPFIGTVSERAVPLRRLVWTLRPLRLCPSCADAIGGACAGPDVDWLPARPQDTCGAADCSNPNPEDRPHA